MSHGKFWELDQEGFIKNEAGIDKIPTHCRVAIDSVVAAYHLHLGSCVHSIYVRGSIPRGEAIPGVSDLDSLAIMRGTAPNGLAWSSREEAKIVALTPLLTGVQFEAHSKSELDRLDHVSELAFVLKTQSVCVQGHDLVSSLPGFKPDVAVANIDIVQIRPDIEEAIDTLLDGRTGTRATHYWCRRIAKNIIRAGFSLVLCREKKFTRDLAPCVESFLKYYPQQRSGMTRALRYALDPTNDAAELHHYLRDFGAWLSNEAKAWLRVHNPDHAAAMLLSLSPSQPTSKA